MDLQTSEKPPHGTCPWAGGILAMQAAPSGLALPSQGQGIATVKGPCNGADCQLWDGSTNMCSLKHIAWLPMIADAVTPLRQVAGAPDDIRPQFSIAVAALREIAGTLKAFLKLSK